MRLKRNRLNVFFLKNRESRKTAEGGVCEAYGEGKALSGEVWPAGGKLQTELYGEHVGYIRNVRINGKYSVQTEEKGNAVYTLADGTALREGDGLCIYVGKDQEPDYRIISIRPDRFLRLEAEKR